MKPTPARSSTPYWLVMATVSLVDSVWVGARDWTIPPEGLRSPITVVLGMLSILLVPRFRQDARVSGTINWMLLVLLFLYASAVLSYLVVSTDAPLTDRTLADWDRLIGFDWPSLFHWMREHPAVHRILQYAYDSLLFQNIIVVLFLGFSGQFETLRRFTRALMTSALVTILLSGFFPAAGAWKFYRVESSANAQIISHFEPLRNGTLRVIDLLNLQGLVSIPSFHTVLALIFAAYMWNTPLRIPFLLLNAVVIVSTPIDGGHYLVDVIAGASLAGTVIALNSPGFKLSHRHKLPAPNGGVPLV